jgi:2-methylcitrate dehydratase PrpD
MTALEQLGAFVARCAAPSPELRETLELHVLDTLGAWVAGARIPQGALLLRWREEWCEIWIGASHARRPAAAAGRDPGPMHRLRLDLATHCALARLSEIDDIHLASTTTPGAIIIPGAIVIAAAFGIRDQDAIAAAMVAGCDAMVRLGEAIGGANVLYRGIWPTYFAAPVAIAAVAARLFELDTVAAANALALALARASPGVGRHNAATTSRWIAIGEAAGAGLVAALAARAGFTSDLALLDAAFLPDVYGIEPDGAAFTALGERSVLSEVSFKPWCAARQTMAATQALIEIIGSGISPEAMTRVTARIPPPHRAMIDHGVIPGDRASFLTSLPYRMAVAALAPQALFEIEAPPDVAEPVRAFMARIAIAEDNALMSEYPRHWPARVEVVTASGRHERSVIHVPGDPERLYDAAAVEAKCRHFADMAIGYSQADELVTYARGLLNGETAPSLLLEEIERHCARSQSRQPGTVPAYANLVRGV